MYHQHLDRNYEAEPLLVAAANRLPVALPDAVVIRAHLAALRENRSCGCDRMDETLDESYCAVIREQIEAEMPGILETVQFVSDADGKKSLCVKVATELTDEQADRLNIVVSQAEAAFRQQITQR